MKTLRARYVFPITRPPIEHGYVSIADGRIVAIGKAPIDGPVKDLGNVALLPGLINAHTHLEFSDLSTPLGVRGNCLVDWIRTLIAHRRATSEQQGAIERGLAESKRHGVCALADIAQPGSIEQWTKAASSSSQADTVFLELLAPMRERVPGIMDIASRFLASSRDRGFRLGLSPHAPYSVHPDLFQQSIDLAVREHLPIAMHLAESPEEMQLLASGDGPMRDFLESIGAWDATAQPSGRRPLDYLKELARVDRSLIVHGNYLDDEEITFIAEHRDRMSVVYCPRTHAWFGHEPYPLEKFIAAGATVGLGTDSRASTPDLSILAEMRHVHRTFPFIPTEKVLELGTLAGAKALGLQDHFGSIEPGKLAGLCAIPFENALFGKPIETLLEIDTPARSIL